MMVNDDRGYRNFSWKIYIFKPALPWPNLHFFFKKSAVLKRIQVQLIYSKCVIRAVLSALRMLRAVPTIVITKLAEPRNEIQYR